MGERNPENLQLWSAKGSGLVHGSILRTALPTVAVSVLAPGSSSGSANILPVFEGDTREMALAIESYPCHCWFAPRFCLFHAFFKTKKATPQIPETKQHFSFPLDNRNRGFIIGAFFR